MEWVTAFYARQYELLGDDASWDIQPVHRERAALVQEIVAPPARVLELGAGGGQVAAAMADLGYDVVANELLPQVSARAELLAEVPRSGTMTVLQGDFFEIEPGGTFDVVSYWDGFGIGSDADQRALLRRVSGWLAVGGRALIEIYTPWYWANAAGRTMAMGGSGRRYEFDGRGSRMLDTWWSESEPERVVTQSLRCYAPADLDLLLEGTALRLVNVASGGSYDPETGDFDADAPLERAMCYLATVSTVL
jgi:SAM-dependent methyltransferase